MAVDKLLKSNELNFQALALIPGFVLLGLFVRLVWKLFSWLYRPSNRKNRDKTKRAFHINLRELQLLMSAIANILNDLQKKKTEKAESEKATLSGKFYLVIRNLFHLTPVLSGQDRISFEEDLSELLGDFPIDSKKETVTRMYRTYPFLQTPFTQNSNILFRF